MLALTSLRTLTRTALQVPTCRYASAASYQLVLLVRYAVGSNVCIIALAGVAF